MQVSTANNVKVYNLSAGKSLPEWISDRKKRTLLKNDVELRRRIELIQDFEMPIASSHIQVTEDEQYILAAGVYKPRVRCYDVHQLSMKFERCFDAEVVNMSILSEDYSKFVLLLSNRYLEFHAQYGYYYRLRIPKFGRDLAYHYPSCDLYVAASSPEVYRLNLEQGRFLNSFTTKSSGCNVCRLNSEHQLLAIGTEEGTVECWDPRSHSRVGELSLAGTGIEFSDRDINFVPEVTALQYKDALNLAVGTSSGQILLFDLRSPRPYYVKDHYYDSPIQSVLFHKSEGLVLSADKKIVKIWHERDGTSFTAIEPEHGINDLCHFGNSGLLFMATEDSKMLSYYIPSLGPAPRWCSFLDNLTEELEENPEPTIYDDYKFVTTKDLDNLGLSHLIGTNLLRAYMHGFFMDMKLYHKAKAIAQPFAYEEYRKERIKKKIEEARANRVKHKKLPKVNRQLAERLLEEDSPPGKPATAAAAAGDAQANPQNPIGDDRFAALFTDPDFEVDEASEEYQLLHPVLTHREKRRVKKKERKLQEQLSMEVTQDEELEGKPSDEESSSDESDQETWREIRRERKLAAAATSTSTDTDGLNSGNSGAGRKQSGSVSKLTMVPGTVGLGVLKKPSSTPLGKRLENENPDEGGSTLHQGALFGSKEMTFTIKKKDDDDETKRQEEMKQHRLERRKVRRSASSILPRTKKGPVYWKGRRVK